MTMLSEKLTASGRRPAVLSVRTFVIQGIAPRLVTAFTSERLTESSALSRVLSSRTAASL